jgi:hypothetical protein
MSRKIEKLTPEQEAKLPTYRDIGFEIGTAIDGGKGIDTDKVLIELEKFAVLRGVPKKDFIKKVVVGDSPIAIVKEHKGLGLKSSNAFYGQHDIHWLITYAFWRYECGLKEETEQMVPLLEMAKLANWYWLHEGVAYVSRKHAKVSTIRGTRVCPRTGPYEGNFTYHADGERAISYVDGTGLWKLFGTNIPENLSHFVTTPAAQLNLKDVLAIINTDIRSAVLKKMGPLAFDALPKTIRHVKTFPIGGTYELVELDFGTGPRAYLKMVCPSKGEVHLEGVPNECQTVDQARGFKEWYPDALWKKKNFQFVEQLVQS